MGRLSEEVIIGAAERFVMEHGKTPTYEELQELLGVKSPTTLNKYYRPWRARRDAELQEQKTPTPAQVELIPIPDSLGAAIAGAWSEVVAEIKSGAQREIQEAQLHLKSRMEQLVADLAERDATITSIEEQSELNQEVHEAEFARLREQLAARETAIEALRGQILQAAEDLSAQRARADLIGANLSEAKAEVATERERTSAEREKTSAALAQVEGLSTEVRSLTAGLEEARGLLAQEREKADNAAAQVAGLSAEVQQLRADLEASHLETAAEREKANMAAERAAGLGAEAQQLRADLDEEKRAAEKERERGDAAVNRSSGLAADVERLKADLAEARGEAAQEREKGSAAGARVAGLAADVQRLEADLAAERKRADAAALKAAGRPAES